MSDASAGLQAGFNKIVDKTGKICKLTSFTYSIGSVWDDELTFSTQTSGTVVAVATALNPAPNPDTTGSYSASGTYNGFPTYNRDAGSWILFFNGINKWGVGSIVDPQLTWINDTETNALTGSYTVLAGGTGDFHFTSGIRTTVIGTGSETWLSGIVLPVNTATGTTDSFLIEQGKLSPTDQKLFMSGNVNLGGSDIQVKIQLGSPTGDQYFVIPDGIIPHEVSDISIFKKAFIRRLTNGSFIGE